MSSPPLTHGQTPAPSYGGYGQPPPYDESENRMRGLAPGFPQPGLGPAPGFGQAGHALAAGYIRQGMATEQTGHSQPTSGQPQHNPDAYYADETQEPYKDTDNNFTFTEKSIRLGFIKKVFGILAVQMLITGAIMCAFVFSEDLKEYSQKNQWMYIAALCIYFAAVIALACVESLRRKTPLNLIMVFIITLAMSFMLGSIASHFDAKEILMAVGIVFAIVLVCALLGLQQKFDFTYLLGIMLVLTIALVFFGLFSAIFRNNYLNIAYACIGAVLFSLWLVIDIQMIMGGKHKYTCNPEEYIFAALNLYLDIVNILMYVLMAIASNK